MKRKIVIWFFIFNIMLFLIGLFCLYKTSENVDYLNEKCARSFYVDDSVDSVMVPSGNLVSFAFAENVVIVYDSYLCKTQEDCIEVVFAIKEFANRNGISIPRSNSDLIGELRLHNFLYELGYRADHTKDADLEYINDYRWYVNVISRLIGWMGI